jgi:hypothetical protein
MTDVYSQLLAATFERCPEISIDTVPEEILIGALEQVSLPGDVEPAVREAFHGGCSQALKAMRLARTCHWKN